MPSSLRVPTPREVGLPERFERWRPEQEDCLRMLLTQKARVKAPAAPVGFGKTAVVVAHALITKRPTCFVTESRGLQDQYMEIYGECGMVDLRGRSNYECHFRPDYTCREGYAANCPHKGTMACPSTAAETQAACSSLVVTNYDKWTSSKKFGRGMEHFEQVVFDEGHEAPAALERAMSITLHSKEVENGLGIDFPSGADEMVNWKPWAAHARIECQDQYQQARADVLAGDLKQTRHMLRLRYLLKRLNTLATANPAYWVVDQVKDGYQFDPIRVGRYAEAMLLLKVPHVIIISGTLRPKTLYMLGLPKESFHFTEYVSAFDAARNPIYYIPTMRVDKNAYDLSPLWVKLDQIASRRQDRRGIVHPISYQRAQQIVAASRFSNRMLLGEKGQGAGDIVELFKRMDVGTILVSPAVQAGYDFPMSAAEWQFICKVPFPDGRAKILKARQEDDKEYGAYQAANKLQQMAGRLGRSKDDQGETFICDEHLDWFYENESGRPGRFSHLFSKTWKKFFRRVRQVPAPLPKL